MCCRVFYTYQISEESYSYSPLGPCGTEKSVVLRLTGLPVGRIKLNQKYYISWYNIKNILFYFIWPLWLVLEPERKEYKIVYTFESLL